MSNLIRVGEYNTKLNSILGLDYKEYSIFRSKGLINHLINRNHFDVLKHIDDIPEIISNPDYVGYDSKDDNKSIIYVKKYDKNLFLTVKLDKDNDYLYVSTCLIKEDKKIQRMLHSGKLFSYIDI